MARTRIMLVEGQDDLHVVSALCQQHVMPDVFDLVDMKGVRPLLEGLRIRLRVGSGIENLAVVVDADENIETRWDQIQDLLVKAGCGDVPDEVPRDGLVVKAPRGIRVGIWLMPDNQVPGMLEDLMTFLIPESDPLLPLVDSFLAEIANEHRRFRPQHAPKARIHAWLAVQEQPGRPLGQAITYKYLDGTCPAVQPFMAWIRRALVD